VDSITAALLSRRGDSDQQDRHGDVPGVDHDAGVAHQPERPYRAQDGREHRDQHALEVAERRQQHQRDHEEDERDAPADERRLRDVAERQHGLARRVDVDRPVAELVDQRQHPLGDLVGLRPFPEVEHDDGRALVGRDQHAAQLGVALDARAERGDLFGRLGWVAHEVVGDDRAVPILHVPHAGRGEADDVLGDDVVQAQARERDVAHRGEDVRPPDVTRLRHHAQHQRPAAAELLADRLVDADERVIRRQAGFDAELGAQVADSGGDHRRRDRDEDEHQPGVLDEPARVAVEETHRRASVPVSPR
jgi:hypothetical protein